jgi:hypothetical protein
MLSLYVPGIMRELKGRTEPRKALGARTPERGRKVLAPVSQEHSSHFRIADRNNPRAVHLQKSGNTNRRARTVARPYCLLSGRPRSCYRNWHRTLGWSSQL